MQTAASIRFRLASAAAVAAAGVAALVFAAASPGGPGALPPDLVTLAIQQQNLIISQEGPRILLRLSNEIGNHAAGPLEVFPGAVSDDCDADADPVNDRSASQRIFADTNGSGAFERGLDAVDVERRFGCMRYHPAHQHWHVADIARYELRREATGKLVAQTSKVGFCLTDTRLVFGGSGQPATPTYPIGSGKPTGCNATSTQGISPGWADTYTFALPGQQLDVTGLPRGRYCLTSRADPLDLIDEASEDNNLRRVRVVLRPRRLAVRKLDEPCRV